MVELFPHPHLALNGKSGRRGRYSLTLYTTMERAMAWN